MARSSPPAEVVAARLEALRRLGDAPRFVPDEERPALDDDCSAEAVARRLEELRAICALAEHLSRARRATG